MVQLFVSGCRDDSRAAGLPEQSFGTTGIGPVEFNYPRAAAICPTGELVIIDKGGRVQVLTQTGSFVRDWHMPQFSAGKPTGVGIGPDGRIYAADTHYARVTVFRPDGTLDQHFGSYGDGPGQFRLPTDVLVDPRGFIYVSEYGGNDRVSRYTMNWEYISSFGGADAGAGRMERPQALCLSRDGSLWIADSCNHRICRFDSEGRFLSAFGKQGSASGELQFPYNVEELSDGTLAVCEYGNNRVQRFSPQGRSLGCWGSAGRELGQLAYPWALALGDGGNLFVIDSGNNRVQVIAALADATWTSTSR